MNFTIWVKIFICYLFIFMPSCNKKTDINWVVYYGDTLKQNEIVGLDLLVVEPDHVNPKEFPDFRGLWVAYLSLGEVHKSRAYFKDLESKNLFVEENKEWPDAYRINVKSKVWEQYVLETLVPDLIRRGYQGLFFDTIDVASYLENKDKEQYAGSVQAMVGLIRAIHEKYPNMLLFPNNGLDYINKLAPYVDGVFVEDLYTSYDFQLKRVVKTLPSVTSTKEEILDLFKSRYHKNIFVIHYADTPKDELSLWALSKAKLKGYHSYITTVDLNTMGFVPTR